MKTAFDTVAPKRTLAQKALQVVYDTPIEIAIGAVIFGSAIGGYTYHLNNAKQGQIPLAFSEIESTIEDFAKEGRTVPPLTRVYSLTSDVAMKVSESNNIAMAKGGSHEDFADELRTRVEPTLKKHALISEYAAQLRTDSANALASLGKIVEAAKDAPAVSSAFDSAWTSSHRDHYYTQVYPSTSCNSKGQCSTTMKTRQVYDYTTHTFTYYPEHGARAAQLLADFVQKHPDVKIEERLQLATRTSPANEAAMEPSLKERLKDKIPTKADILGYANTWAVGSNFTTYTPAIKQNHGALEDALPAWQSGKDSAKSASYRTKRRSDSGPREFQIAERAKNAAAELHNASRKITDGIRAAGQEVPVLEAKIRNYIEVVDGNKKGDANKLRVDVMSSTRSIYERNFENGFDLNPFKWAQVILFAVIGIFAGCLVGTGADRYIDHWRRRKIYEDGHHRRNVGDVFHSTSTMTEEFLAKAKRSVANGNDAQAASKPKRKLTL